MVTLPDDRQLGRIPSASSGRRVVQIDTASTVEAGGQALARGLDQASAGVQEFIKRRDTYDIARADAEYLVRKQQLYDDLGEETEPDKLDDKYKPLFQKAASDSSSMIRSQQARNMWETRRRPDFEGNRIAVENRSEALFKDRRIASANESLINLRQAGLKGGNAQDHIRSANELISGLVAIGDISATKAQQLRESWGQDFIGAKLEIMEPGQRISALRDTSGFAASIPEDSRVKMLRSAIKSYETRVDEKEKTVSDHVKYLMAKGTRFSKDDIDKLPIDKARRTELFRLVNSNERQRSVESRRLKTEIKVLQAENVKDRKNEWESLIDTMVQESSFTIEDIDTDNILGVGDKTALRKKYRTAVKALETEASDDLKDTVSTRRDSLLSNSSPDNYQDAIVKVAMDQAALGVSDPAKYSREHQNLNVEKFANDAANKIVAEQVVTDPEGYRQFLSDNPSIASNLTSEELLKFHDTANTNIGKRIKREKLNRQLTITRANPDLIERAKGIGEREPLTIEDANGMLAQAIRSGEPAETVEYFRELSKTVLHRGGKADADNLKASTLAKLNDKMTELGIRPHKVKGKVKGVVDRGSTVSDIMKLQTEVLKAERRGEITPKQSATLQNKILPAYLSQVTEEEGTDWLSDLNDVYNVGFEVIQTSLEQNNLEDEINLKAAMFTTFLNMASKEIPEGSDPEQLLAEQVKIGQAVTRSFVKYLSGGLNYQGEPTDIILPNGRRIGLANAATPQASARRLGSGSVVTRQWRDKSGKIFTGNFVKGTNIRVGN